MSGRASLSTPVFETLGRTECERLLKSNSVARVAFTFRDRVDIQPVHYVYDDGWLYGRTEEGDKLETLAHHQWVAVEVDEVDGVFDWRSVVARGSFFILDPEGAADARDARDRAIDLLRSIVPATGTGADPVAFRHIYFRIHVDELTGRRARSR